jgi:hypothetical protein
MNQLARGLPAGEAMPPTTPRPHSPRPAASHARQAEDGKQRPGASGPYSGDQRQGSLSIEEVDDHG